MRQQRPHRRVGRLYAEPQELGHLLKQARVARAWSQAQVGAEAAWLLGRGEPLSTSFISRLEAGLQIAPPATLMAISLVLGLDYNTQTGPLAGYVERPLDARDVATRAAVATFERYALPVQRAVLAVAEVLAQQLPDSEGTADGEGRT